MEFIKKISVLTAVSCSFLFIPYAHAQCGMPMGYYFEGDIGTTRFSNNVFGDDISVSSKKYGLAAAIGYKFMPYFAAEIGAIYYGKSTLSFLGTNFATANTYAGYAAGKGMLPLGDTGLEAFGKLGYAQARSKISPNSTASSLGFSSSTQTANGIFYALGVGYVISPNMQAILQWSRVQTNNNSGNLDLLALGIIYQFEC